MNVPRRHTDRRDLPALDVTPNFKLFLEGLALAALFALLMLPQ